jgi:hypothetical protein
LVRWCHESPGMSCTRIGESGAFRAVRVTGYLSRPHAAFRILRPRQGRPLQAALDQGEEPRAPGDEQGDGGVLPKVTLVIAATCRESIWIAADRGLTDEPRRQAVEAWRRQDHASWKHPWCRLLAFLVSAKLWAERKPSDWMNAVLRDRNEPLVQSLEILGSAIKNQIPNQMPRSGRACRGVCGAALLTMIFFAADLEQSSSFYDITPVH